MRGEDKKYMWWGLLGIGVAALFYFLSQNKSQAQSATVPYLVEQPLQNANASQNSNVASPSAQTSLSNQPNIVGVSPNSTITNGTAPGVSSANPFENTGSWSLLPNLTVSNPSGPNNAVNGATYTSNSFPVYQSPPPEEYQNIQTATQQ